MKLFFTTFFIHGTSLIMGDLNAKSEILGCRTTNKNGIILENILLNSNLIVANNSSPTYHCMHRNNQEILDWVLVSNEVSNTPLDFEVLNENLVDSDHYPIMVTLKVTKTNEQEQSSNAHMFNYKKTNWENFREDLTKSVFTFENKSVNEINDEIVKEIKNSMSKNIPVFKQSTKTMSPLPQYLLYMIKHRKYLKNQIKKQPSSTQMQTRIRNEYNCISKAIKDELTAIENKKWLDFVEKQGKHPTCSSKFWKKIKGTTHSKIRSLKANGKIYHGDQEKANLFSNLLAQTFSSDTIEPEKTELEHLEQMLINTEPDKIELITLNELNEQIKKLKNKSSSGIDGIPNIVIKNLPENVKRAILKLFNRSISDAKIPKAWKIATITMIPKKSNELENPANYRPISLISCIGKLLERMILTRIQNHLKKHKIILKQQSGFRSHRQTKDNLLFIIQKIQESFVRKKKVLAFFFDISQAFDKVWHLGLLTKLSKIKLPLYLIRWLQDFMKERYFQVRIGELFSEMKTIKCGVPQGAVLSPTLFSVYINDVPMLFSKNHSYSLLFADDITTFFIFKNDGHLKKKVNDYMLAMETWLKKWRLTMHPKKCNQMVFNVNSNKKLNHEQKFKLFGDTIPACDSLKFLGITFDLGLNFNEHIKNIKKKCINRLNIIKLISNPAYKLNKKTLTTVYLSLIRSIIDYSSLIVPLLSKALSKTMQAVQNIALKIIYRLKYDTHTEEVVALSGIKLVKDRANELNQRYIMEAKKNENELLIDLFDEYKIGGKNFKNKTVLCLYKNLM